MPIKIGQVFNRLTVVEILNIDSKKEWKIRCQCSCGTMVSILSSSIRSGHTKSCGCLKIERTRKPPGETSFSTLFNICHKQAIRREIPFSLTKEEHKIIITQNCYHCGALPSGYNPYLKADGISKSGSAHGVSNIQRAQIYVNGVDRIDSSIGYLLENCVPCCKLCNKIKTDLPEAVFIGHAIKIAAYQSTKGVIDVGQSISVKYHPKTIQ